MTGVAGEPLRGRDEGGAWRRTAWWGVASALLGLLVWYPAGGWPGSRFWGLGGALPPVQLIYGYLVVLGSAGSGLGAALVVRDWWARLLVLLAASALFWVLVEVPPGVPLERVVLLALFLPGQALGLLLGTLLRRGPRRCALGLALVAAVGTQDAVAVWLVALGLVVAALSVRPARPHGVGGAVTTGVLAVALFLGVRTLAFALVYGWGVVRRGSGYPDALSEAVRRVAEPALDFLRAGGAPYLGELLRLSATPLLVGAALAVVVGVARARRGRAGGAGSRGADPTADLQDARR
ncbi:hypothetical protein [Lapillicoccus jejuensis]|uniref:Uncharacterized protein n=1 Tax=Lapillicoccus jejuensis TaxID=402171 RepID=A0A542DX50_9MICO|nr:hypothetical protein [Lapillicoccus jejuensis]TQJ07494.1 hypothetical protein FB458_0556 [Lapillicoccus jejuensis]